MARLSKNQERINKANDAKLLEEKRIKEILLMSNSYTTALHPLIDLYLDAYEVYHIRYSEWKSIGFKSTKRHKNKDGATNEIKHPIAQQVEVWSDKKSKLLNQIGLDSKNKNLPLTGALINDAKNGANETREPDKNENKLVQMKRMRK